MKKITEMSEEEIETKEVEISKIKTVDELLNWLADDILDIIKDNNEIYEIEKLINFYHKCMIDNFVNDDCEEVADNIIITPLKLKCLKQAEDDLLNAEYYINKLNVETRRGKFKDDFKSMKTICDDIAKVYGVKID